MKQPFLIAKTVVLLLGLLASVGCGISAAGLRATLEVEIRPTVAAEVWQTAEFEMETAVAATVTSTATQRVAFMSFHGRYVTAMGENGGWSLRQEPELGDCGWFTRRQLDDGKITLETCHGRHVTAPRRGITRWDWMLGQQPEPDDCGQFVLHDLGSDGVALQTCAGRFVTAGDGNWPGELAWSVVGETDEIKDWERFKMLQP
jgi:hypothetical protein